MSTTSYEDQKQYVDSAQMAYKLAREYLPRYAHAKSPHHFTFQQLGGIVLLRTVMRLSYREMQQFLLDSDEVRRAFELRNVPDYSTLMRTEVKMKTQINEMLHKFLLQMQANNIPLTWMGYLGAGIR
ncbi:MAG: hypothetical protein KIH69_004490 [Anaerolineae bacterium]|nr:hypothetical protein [Anaerolineae bacterium]